MLNKKNCMNKKNTPASIIVAKMFSFLLFCIFLFFIFSFPSKNISAADLSQMICLIKRNGIPATPEIRGRTEDECSAIYQAILNEPASAGKTVKMYYYDIGNPSDNPAVPDAIIGEPLRETTQPQAPQAPSNFDYLPMETVPGVFTANTSAPNFNALISNIYSFLITIVGICALFMITMGGYMYLTSAGNTALAGKAKSVITDAIIGLVLALLAYLIFYTINPALVNPVGLRPIGNTGAGGTSSGSGSVPSGGNVPAAQGLGNIPVVSSRSCTNPTGQGCTNTELLPSEAINRAVTINETVPIIITGGAESAGHSSHGPGIDRTDIQPADGDYNRLGAYLVENRTSLGITQICTTPEYSQYRINCDTDEQSNHFHIAGA